MPSRLFRGCSSSLTSSALQELFCLGVDSPADNSCYITEVTNSCGESVKDTLLAHPIYGPLADIYNRVVPTQAYSYEEEQTASLISEDGLKISVYSALQDLNDVSIDFDPNVWELICEINLGEQFPTPSLEELEETYDYYLVNGDTIYEANSVVLYDDGLTERVYLFSNPSEVTASVDDSFPNDNWISVFYVLKKDFQYCAPSITKEPKDFYEVVGLDRFTDEYIEYPKSFAFQPEFVYGDPSNSCPSVVGNYNYLGAPVGVWNGITGYQFVVSIPTDNTTFNLRTTGAVNYTVYWGDGEIDCGVTENIQPHLYAEAGDYTIQIRSTVPFRFFADNIAPDATYITRVIGAEPNFPWANSFADAWHGCSNLVDFPKHVFDNWTTAPADGCFDGTWRGCSLSVSSVENILNSIDASGQFAPGSGTNISIDYDTNSGTPDIAVAVANLEARGWTLMFNEPSV